MLTVVVAILAGLVLLSGALRKVPGVGPGLERFARWLSAFDVVIGVIAIVVGVLELLSLEGILLILAGFVLAVSALRSIPSIGPPLGRLGSALAEFRVIIGIILLLVGLLDLLQLLFGSLGHIR
jgi:membrane protein HdeD